MDRAPLSRPFEGKFRLFHQPMLTSANDLNALCRCQGEPHFSHLLNKLSHVGGGTSAPSRDPEGTDSQTDSQNVRAGNRAAEQVPFFFSFPSMSSREQTGFIDSCGTSIFGPSPSQHVPSPPGPVARQRPLTTFAAPTLSVALISSVCCFFSPSPCPP